MVGVDHCAIRRDGTLKALSSGSRSSTLLIFDNHNCMFQCAAARVLQGEGSARRGFCKDGPQSCANGGGRIGAASQACAPNKSNLTWVRVFPPYPVGNKDVLLSFSHNPKSVPKTVQVAQAAMLSIRGTLQTTKQERGSKGKSGRIPSSSFVYRLQSAF